MIFFTLVDSKCALLCTVDLVVDEVFRYEHLEDPKSSRFIDYPTCQKYFLYGDKSRAFISHVITKDKDFHQVLINFCKEYQKKVKSILLFPIFRF